NVGGVHVVGGLAIDGDDDVTRPNTCAVGRSADEGGDNDDFVITWTYLHAYAVVFAALLFAQGRVGLGIKEIRVRIEDMQHARDSAVIDGLIRIYRLGIVLLDQVIDGGKIAQTVANVIAVRDAGASSDALPEDG